MKFKASRKTILLSIVGTVTLVALVTGIIVWQVVDWDKDDSIEGDDGYVLEPSDSVLGIYNEAAVATDAPYCSEIGKQIFKDGGSVADATIAAMLCVGVVQTQSMGLGGGFLLVYYNAATGKTETLNARDRAPAAASQDMFAGDPDAAARGNLSVAVPGELKGYWELWKKHGKIPWKNLFEPTIALATNGFSVTAHAANALISNKAVIFNTTSLREVFVNNETNEVFKEGEVMKRPVLAQTLRVIADSGAPDIDAGDVLYRDTELMKKFVTDLKEEGGIITEDDMKNYKVTWDDPIQMDIEGGFKVHSTPPPGSGVLLAFFMKLLSSYQMSRNSVTSYQRIMEAFKHGYAKRTFLGDPEDPEVKEEVEKLKFNLTSPQYMEHISELIFDDRTNQTHEYYGAEYYQPEDHGTSHLCILAPNGDAIAVTSTINLYFGSFLRSRNTGIVYNDMMDDFSSPNVNNSFGVPPSKNNFIRPGKRPVSSMTPAIFTDNKGKVRLVIGGAGGTKITTAVTMVAIRNLWFGENIKEAVDARRLHHQLYPMQIEYEKDFNLRIIEGLEKIGHTTDEFNVGTSVVQAIARSENGTIYANADFRKKGTVAGY